MHKGAIKEQARLMDENLAKCETLKNVQIKKTEVNGREIFEVTLPDGNRKVANSVEEVIANCNVLMQLDIISNAAKENAKEEVEWRKMSIGGEEVEVAVVKNANGVENIDFSKCRKLNANGQYEEFVLTTERDLLNSESDTGISTMSDAEFATQGKELCRRSDGTESPAARALLEAVRNSELTKRSYDPNMFNLEEFKNMSRDYSGNLFDEVTLEFMKEMVECIPKGKNDDLLISTDSSIKNIIMFQFKNAKHDAKLQILYATKKLLSNPHVRNGIVDDIIESCTEGNSKDGYTFNQKAFDTINKLLVKQEVNGYEQYPIKNREFTQDFTYSLMVAEIAKNAIRYGTDTNGKQIKYFDDIGFKIGMAQPAADPGRSYVHYDITKDRNTGEIDLHDRANIHIFLNYF